MQFNPNKVGLFEVSFLCVWGGGWGGGGGVLKEVEVKKL